MPTPSRWVVLMLALAIWRKSRPLLFAWCFLMFSVLPFIFVPHYSGFFMYLPMVGWTLYAATRAGDAARPLRAQASRRRAVPGSRTGACARPRARIAQDHASLHQR